MTHSPFLPVRRPISAWNKPLKLPGKGLFLSLTQAVGHGITGNFTELANDAAGVLTSVGLETRPEERAWLLIRRALVRATCDLVAEQQSRLGLAAAPDDALPSSPPAPPAPPAARGEQARQDRALARDTRQLDRELDDRLEAAELEIGPDFFDRPGSLAVLGELAGLLAEWLESHGAGPVVAPVIAHRLQSYFVYALHAEWRRDRSFYEPVLDSLSGGASGPFVAAAGREQAWRENAARLRRVVNEPLFGESFGLEQIYVARRAAYNTPYPPARPSDPLAARDRPVVADLDALIDSWLDAMDRDDAIRVIGGGPGSGKSSFARMLACRFAGRILRTVYVPLFDLDLDDSLAAALDSFVDRLGLPRDLLHPERGEDRLLIIFDGLDELGIRGKLGVDSTAHFFRQVERAVRGMNRDRCRLQVVITSRELAIPETELAHHGQLVHILPFYTPPGERERYRDPAGLLARDDRHAWWQRYGEVTGRAFTGMPDELGRADLVEITAEPLLCYLVALSYTAARLDFTGHDVDRNQIYADLLARVYERAYEGRRRHPSLQELDQDQYIAILEEIGLAAWHGHGNATTIGAIRRYCARSPRLGKLIDRFEKDAEAGVTGLLLAFYFRKADTVDHGERTFEFTHRSFGEYLTARRLVRACEHIVTRVAAGDRGDELGWTEDDALKHWVEIAGPAAVDRYVLRFVQREMGHQRDAAGRCQAVFTRLIGRMLRTAMPMERLERMPYRKEVQHARNAEVALFAIADACARASEQPSRIDWPSRSSFGAWLRTVQGQRVGLTSTWIDAGALVEPMNLAAIPVILACLSRLDLGRCILSSTDLVGADLDHAILAGAILQGADLAFARLRGADLAGACLDDANLRSAALGDARLASASLRRASLRDADLRSADLSYADLTAAVLVTADLDDASLQGSTLDRADLEGASLVRARLHDASLQGARLRGANLSSTSLRAASVRGASLRDAVLDDTDLDELRDAGEAEWPVGFAVPPARRS